MTAVPIDHSHRRRSAEPGHRRTFSPVRRNSRPAGGEQWPHMSKRQGARLILALEIHQEKQRRKGERTGCAPRDKTDAGGLSQGAVKLARILVNIAVKRGGKVYPSVAYLAQCCNVPAKTIHAWKAQLKRHGFLDWCRRWVETGRQGVRGPQVEQTSNAYWLKLPKEAAEAVEKVLGPRKAEEDDASRISRMSPEMQATIARLDEAARRRAERGSTFGRLDPT